MKKNNIHFWIQRILIEMLDSGIKKNELRTAIYVQAAICLIITILVNANYFIGLFYDADNSALSLLLFNIIAFIYWSIIEMQYNILKKL